MNERRKYTVSEKIKYTRLFLKNQYSFGEMKEAHGIPSTTMQRWVKIYNNEGIKGFEKTHKGNSNGTRPKAIPKFTPKSNESVEQELERLRTENAYLKKLQALIQQRQPSQKK